MARLAPGSVLGRYEVLAHIGSGGMGDVYRARDNTLEKTVALKTITTAYAEDPASKSRFERERRLTASLEHPHICRLLDAGREQGVDYLAIEYLEGQSLARRLAQGPLPVHEAIECAIEIADALEYAHGRGVIHRDLKPGNVFLTATGVKLLDFGLAKLRRAVDRGAATSDETASLDATQAGTLIGSVPYMAPERLEGRDADVRSDVFALGVVLYEMLAGQRAFNVDSPAALVAAILLTEPPPLNLEHPKAADLEWIVRRCLAKNPDARWQSTTDLKAVLKRLAGPGFAELQRPARRRSLVQLAALGLVVAAGLAWFLARGSAEPESPRVEFTVPPPPGGYFTPAAGPAQMAVAPDGRSLAFVASLSDGVPRIWLRRLDSARPTPLVGTEEAAYPFWSPDGKALGFFARQTLKRIDVVGGPPRTLAPAPAGRGGSWSVTGDILFAPDTTGTISRIPAAGGSAVPATRLNTHRGENSHRWPVFLPDGRRFLYFAHGTMPANDGLYLSPQGGREPLFITSTGFGGAFVPPNRVLFLGDESLLALTIDFDEGAIGDPVPVAERVAGSSTFYGAFSVSHNGVIAYANPASTSDLVWADRTGRTLRTVSASRHHEEFRLSPDGTAIASADEESGTGFLDVFVLDLLRGSRLRVTSSPATDGSPVWAPDGRRVVYRSNRHGMHDLFVKDPSDTASDQVFLASPYGKYPTSWSPDGRWIAFHVRAEGANWDVGLVPGSGGTSKVLLGSDFNESQAQFSPNGRLLAYTSDESERAEVYVQSLGDQPRRVQASVEGGDDPRWRRDGEELFYVAADGYLTAVPVREERDGIAVGAPQRLFRVREGPSRPPYLSSYDVAPDGRQFLIRVTTDEVRAIDLTVLVNASISASR